MAQGRRGMLTSQWDADGPGMGSSYPQGIHLSQGGDDHVLGRGCSRPNGMQMAQEWDAHVLEGCSCPREGMLMSWGICRCPEGMQTTQGGG